MKEIKYKKVQLHDSILMMYKNRQNQSMEIEVKMAVTVGTTAWEGHKEMFLILIWVLAP